MAMDNRLAMKICGNSLRTVCHFASYEFNEKQQIETLKIAFAAENEFIDALCVHSKIYLKCNDGCAQDARSIEMQQIEDEDYPVMLGPVSSETYDEINRQNQLRKTTTTFYLPPIILE